jgi:hypothetical protein
MKGDWPSCGVALSAPTTKSALAFFWGGVHTTPERTVYFVHQSAEDILCDGLLKTGLPTVFPRRIEGLHHILFSESLQLLSRTLCRDIYRLSHPGFPVEDATSPSPDPLGPAQYLHVIASPAAGGTWLLPAGAQGQVTLVGWRSFRHPACEAITFLVNCIITELPAIDVKSFRVSHSLTFRLLEFQLTCMLPAQTNLKYLPRVHCVG